MATANARNSQMCQPEFNLEQRKKEEEELKKKEKLARGENWNACSSASTDCWERKGVLIKLMGSK